ncbi:hypothetical protein CcaverHIS002_0605600 [Cutaneotrichosporon cavernicola]|uniref:RRM domain-containing protein n=1 Tax=Cutaneotrichosporon cavernicola TaxID=279322 RepID=A0AA48L8R5_9TREE|nr:uncharacterized protein CcaverHIS019_0605060 [Cutaneotrichosporon cavernicola]BEI86273.1 hypothetical protein CcaverHIS002_0605600 [Cutaneotrichosporon cavernicola]BEI94047.1 hypothetical protein CcaverHIS019_0605060 [Cutaneotrichosporon cavernicola]BEJ01826.1 hypothetical protein CcaverHIS631_0605080 [Cutaneotrichosporon cavernicola]BEJ09591.1 hypothetical protein CcaverHIS641_0605060 [Cutaneotrichosporon cavernicola]
MDAGPSRHATVTDEAEELVLEAGVPTSTEVNGNGTGAASPVSEPEASETLYLHNLNEKVQVDVMKTTLTTLFKPYHPLQPIIAHGNARMKGQAFISFRDKETAERAMEDVAEFPLYGKPIIIQFAKKRSDVVIKREQGEEEFEKWLVERKEHKKTTRNTNAWRLKQRAKHQAGATDEPSAAKKPRLQMPDEYLPPNNVLFVQNLPDGTTAEDLREVFEQYAGLQEIRTVPAKRDIAFVEFVDEVTSAVAKDALHNFKIDGETKMKVTFARK